MQGTSCITTRLTCPPSNQIQQIFNLLLAVNKHHNCRATLRVAGGWVRDQLLGIEANDVDIAIESPAGLPKPITGADFANLIKQYQEAQGIDKATVSVVKTNPDKSKHIETAQMMLHKLQIEFCHLRADDYTQNQDSRIPVVRAGTPLEDALRRDFTVNALYYNLHSELVEDFTTGLQDMEKRVLRCPLAPLETFLDDPLRLLRGIRFAGQLSYELHESIVNCVLEHGPAKLIPVIETKISRERIGIEVGKMFGRRNPMRCVELLHKTQLMYTSLLSEHYFMSTKNGRKNLGGPVKTQPNPTHTIATLPSPLLAQSRGEGPLNQQLQEHFDTYGQLSHQRGTVWLDAILRQIDVPQGDPRIAATVFSFLGVPLLTQDGKNLPPSYPRVLFDEEPSVASSSATGAGGRPLLDAGPKSSSEIYRYRLNSILGYAMKMPARHATQVGKMLDAYEALAPHWSRMVADVQGAEEGSQPPTNGNFVPLFQGGRREGLFEALRSLADEDKSLLPVVVATLAMESCGVVDGTGMVVLDSGEADDVPAPTAGGGGAAGGNSLLATTASGQAVASTTWVAQYRKMITAFADDEPLHNLLKQGPKIKGNVLAGLLGIEHKQIGKCVDWQRRFLIHNPYSSEEDIVSFLKAKLDGGSAGAPAE